MTGPAPVGPAGASAGESAQDPLEERWSALVRDWPDLRAAAAVVRTTLSVLRDAGPIAAPIALTVEQVHEKISNGEHLLRGCALRFERDASRDLMLRLARALEAAGLEGVVPILRALEEDRLVPVELLARAAHGDHPSVAARANEQDLSPDILWALAQSAVKPALRAWCGELAPLVHGSGAWEKGICYLCGVPASLAELQGNDQARHLRCGRCGGDWRFHRFGCAHCGNEEAASLGVLYPEGRRDKFRVEVCDRCQGYLKVVVRFAPASPEEMALEDLSTLYLDEYARKQGYLHPPIR